MVVAPEAGDINDHALKEELYSMLVVLEGLASTPVPELGSVVVWDSESSPPDDVRFPDEWDILLKELRHARSTLQGLASSQLQRAAQNRFPEIAKDYEAAIGAALEKLKDMEAFLILMGAGSEEDAHLGEHLIPAPRDVPAGPSVTFEF